MVPVEPLHDLKEHINNILRELPKHLIDTESTLFEEALEAVLSKKSAGKAQEKPSTLSVDEAELSDDGRVMNGLGILCTHQMTNRILLLLILPQIQLMLTATSNWSQSMREIKKIREIKMSVKMRCYELNMLSQ